MTIEQVFLAALSIGCGVLGWLARELWAAVQALRQDLEHLKVHIADNYVRQDRMDRAMEKALAPLLENLRRIEQAVSQKADKP